MNQQGKDHSVASHNHNRLVANNHTRLMPHNRTPLLPTQCNSTLQRPQAPPTEATGTILRDPVDKGGPPAPAT